VRKLPLQGEVLVGVGDRVEPETPVARITLRPGIPWVIPVASHLGVLPSELRSKIVKSTGEIVKAQEVLAVVDHGFYGRKEYKSPVEGRIEEISDITGRVTIREEFGKVDPSIEVDVASDLKCKPSEVPQNMIRRIGQEVKKGEMLAKKGDLQAFLTKTSLTPVSGVVSQINPVTGKVTVSRPFKQVTVNAYVSGTVSGVTPGSGCVVETPGISISGIFGVGRETHGGLRVLTGSPDEVLTPEMITAGCAGKVIVGGSFATNEALAKAVEIGVSAVVTGTVNYFNLTQSLGVKLGVGITGQEDVSLTVVLMEGFGRLSMRREVWETLKALEGMDASVNGATQIRAGAIRPEVIIPLPLYDGRIGERALIDEDLQAGMRVRIVSEPYFGVLGVVSEVVREPRLIETEARVPVVSVRMADGGTAVVPRANVEIF
jgi:transcription antitermination factor NusG